MKLELKLKLGLELELELKLHSGEKSACGTAIGGMAAEYFNTLEVLAGSKSKLNG